MYAIENLKENLKSSIHAKSLLMESTAELEQFGKAVKCVIDSYQKGGRLYIAGNGGSAADAQHLATEFVSKLARPRDPIPAEALTVDTSTLTAIGNDYGFELLFSRQLTAKATPKDVFLAITTSGQSKNILRALEECRRLKVPSILFSGRDGGPAKPLADICVIATGKETSQIQEVQMVLYHTLCGCVESALFPNLTEKS